MAYWIIVLFKPTDFRERERERSSKTVLGFSISIWNICFISWKIKVESLKKIYTFLVHALKKKNSFIIYIYILYILLF